MKTPQIHLLLGPGTLHSRGRDRMDFTRYGRSGKPRMTGEELLPTLPELGALAAIEKSIRESDLGLQPSNDGIVIRLSFPALTEERRKEYVKVVKNMAEDARVACRQRWGGKPPRGAKIVDRDGGTYDVPQGGD